MTPERKDNPMSTQLYFDYDQLTSAYEQASQHAMPQGWRNALDKGFDLLLASGAISVEFSPMGDIAYASIPSQSEPGIFHSVNGTCDCKAGAHGNPCAHRAAKRLLAICHEQQATRVVASLPALRRFPTAEILNVDAVHERASVVSGIGDLFPD
jgi:hypothetical protein